MKVKIIATGTLLLLQGIASAQFTVTQLSPASGSATPVQTYNSSKSQYATWNVTGGAAPLSTTFSLSSCSGCTGFSGTSTDGINVQQWTPSGTHSSVIGTTTIMDAISRIRTSSATFAVHTAPLSNLDCGSATTCVTPSLDTIPSCTQNPCFTGTADPSLRRDASGDLWLSYSFPHWNYDSTNATYTQAVDIRLVESQNGGQTWGTPTILYQAGLATYGCASGTWSSHEVSNLWYDSPSTNWFSVRADYCSPEGGSLYQDYSAGGFVLASATAPTALAGVSTKTLNFTTLTYKLQQKFGTGVGCTAWNEPAITVSGSNLTLYAQCLPSATSTNSTPIYYIFTMPSNLSTITTSNISVLTISFGGPSDVTLIDPADAGSTSFLTEFDIAPNPGSGNGYVAVATTAIGSGGSERHYGCTAAEFNPSVTSGSPFTGTVDAKVLDTGTLQDNGACTYEPTSATGILVTQRKYVSLQFAIVESGYMP